MGVDAKENWIEITAAPSVVRLADAQDAGRRERVGQATDFVVKHTGRAYPVSNGHVFSGRDPFTRASRHTPTVPIFKIRQ